MTGDVSAGLPLVHEEDADGLVAAVFLDIRSRMPFVPALFKAMAPDPEALLAAWLQARAIYDHQGASSAASAIRESARVATPYQPSQKTQETVKPYLAELPLMLLIVTFLQLSLSRDLPRGPAPEPNLPAARTVPEPLFSDRAEHALFEEICATYGTQHLPSIYRSLAANGVLEEVWSATKSILVGDVGEQAVARVSAEAELQARALPVPASFGVDRVGPILNQFARALPRNLIVARAAGRFVS